MPGQGNNVCLLFRLDCNDRYFNDTWEGLPKNGYTAMFENLILKDPKITVRLEMDFFKVIISVMERFYEG